VDSAREKKLIEKFSLPLGLAFQINDDIQGVFGKEKATGKSAVSDILEGKRTLLVDGTIGSLSVFFVTADYNRRLRPESDR